MPGTPGIYMFMAPTLESGKETILYIGKAASLKDRVKSYFGGDILRTRGLHISNMVALARTIKWIETDSTLEALLLENRLIKKWKPHYNTKEKDDKSFNYVIITGEKFPRVLIVRGKNLDELRATRYKLKTILGPFPHGAILREAMKIIRKIFPYRDTCIPLSEGGSGNPCFNRQLGLCPGACTGEITKKDYAKRIKEINLFFIGGKEKIIKNLEREMNSSAKFFLFEKANAIKKRIFALKHIKDISLLKDISQENITDKKMFRIEAYDVAHLSGASRIGVMAVIENGEPNKSEYRTFNIRDKKMGDTDALREILERRFNHPEWRMPDLIVVDGGAAQFNVARKIMNFKGQNSPVVSVVKDDRHKPKNILGPQEVVDNFEGQILLANSEAHRFSLSRHIRARSFSLKIKKNKNAAGFSSIN
ncbi:MAG: GIY-YIG nuclease family protein [Patescibacteria group bacterium]